MTTAPDGQEKRQISIATDLARRGSGLRSPRFGSADRFPMHQEHGEKQQRADDDDRQEVEAQAGDDSEGDHGAQGKSQVAPDAKHRHAGGQVLAGKIVGGFITFGMIRRHPEAAHHHQQQNETIVARGRQQRQTQAGGETPEGKQDELLLLVGKITEQRLHDGGSEICRHQNDAGHGIRKG